MEKKIEKSSVSRILYELQKLQQKEDYLKTWKNFPGNVRTDKVLRVYFRLLASQVKAIAFAENDPGGPVNIPTWSRISPSGKTDSETIRFEKCISDNSNLFYTLTRGLVPTEWKILIHSLFALFPKYLVAVWQYDDSILINELFLRELNPSFVESGLTKVFQIQIKGEESLQHEFETEEALAQKEREERKNCNTSDYHFGGIH